jgi:hypothetical protein
VGDKEHTYQLWDSSQQLVQFKRDESGVRYVLMVLWVGLIGFAGALGATIAN